MGLISCFVSPTRWVPAFPRNLGLLVNMFCDVLKDYSIKNHMFQGITKCIHKFADVKSAGTAHSPQLLTTWFWLEVTDRIFKLFVLFFRT